MEKNLFIALSIAGMLIGTMLFAQGEGVDTSSAGQTENNPYYINSYHLQPVLLPKGKFLFLFHTNIPHYYKWYSPKAGKPEKLSSKMVINEFNFNAMGYYGLTDRLNLFLRLPFRDVHYYSPMGTRAGIGFGDVVTGGSYSLSDPANTGKNEVTAGIDLTFPSAKYKNLEKDDAALGEGSFRFRGNVTGLHRAQKFNFIYSLYYEYRTNHSGYHIGDETGAYFLFQKPFNTSVGRFGIESSLYAYWKFKNTKEGETIPNTEDYAVSPGLGGWYECADRLYLRFNVPFYVFQNSAWMTRYDILIQLDYVF